MHYNKIAITIGKRTRENERNGERKRRNPPGAARESTDALYSDKMILSIVNAPARRQAYERSDLCISARAIELELFLLVQQNCFEKRWT